MMDNNFTHYARTHLQIIEDIKSRNYTAQQLNDIFFDTMFYRGLHGPTNTILKTQLDQIYEQSIWPSAADSIAKFSMLLSTKENYDAYSGTGVILANAATKRNSNSTTRNSNSICWNCGRAGHILSNCKSPDSTCATCSGPHHTSAHEAVKAAEARAISRGKNVTSMLRPRKVAANMAEESSRDSTYDDEQYDSLQTLAANQINLDTTENDADLPYDEQEFIDDEPTSSIFSYNTTIRHIPDESDDDSLPPPLVLSSDSEDDEIPHARVTHKKSTVTDTSRKTIVAEAAYLDHVPVNTVLSAFSAINIHDAPSDVVAYLDSAAGGHIFLPVDRFNCMFTHVTVSKGIVIEGVDESAAPIPVVYTARHAVLGHCHFAQVRNRLISIPMLLKKEFSMLGKRGSITINDKNGTTIFNSSPDEKGLFPVNLTKLSTKLVKAMLTVFDGTLVHAPPRIEKPMSALEIQRAHMARDMHIANGHPSFSTMKEGLDNGAWPGVDLTSRDLVNSINLLGECAGCAEGKMVNPSEPEAAEVRAYLPGELLYMDLIKSHTRCIGGHTQALVGRDYVTSYLTVNGLSDKTTQSILQAILSVIAFYASYGHTVKVIVFDHESTFVSLEHKIPGIRTQFTPAHLKNKHVERAIREIREKDRCTRANLPYELPADLEIECWIAVSESINLLPNSASGPNHTPFQLVTNMRPSLRPIPFGTAVLAYARSNNDPQQRAEWGIYLSERFRGDSRVYLPQSKVIVSRRKVVPQTSYPNDWKFIRRPKLIHASPRPSVLDIPPSDTDVPAINPLVAINPFTTVPPPEVTTSTAITTVQQQPTIPFNFPSISRFIPDTIPTVNETQYHAKAAAPEAMITTNTPDVTATTTPIATDTTATAERRYNLRQSHKPPTRYQAHMSLPASVKAYDCTYAKSNKGIPVMNNAAPNHINLDKIKARIIACRISMRQALKDPDPVRATAATTAMTEELTQLVDSGTFEPKTYDSLNDDQKRRVIPSHMFFKDKFFADGRFQKLKARLVAGGNFVDTSLIGDISSWTVNPISVMMMLNVAALAQNNILTIDVKGAFLIPELTDSPEDLTYVTIDKMLSEEIVKIKPAWRNKRNHNGTFTMQLRKTLYGLGISSNRWMTHLNTTLVKLGFTVSQADCCCFSRGLGRSKLIICSHVDDILCVGNTEKLQAFKAEFEKEYEINTQEGYKHSYIGLDIIQEPSTSKVSIGQTGYRRDVLNRFSHLLNNSRADGRVPCGLDIVEADPPDSEPVDRSVYMSIIMSVMFLSRFTRPDLSFAVSMLSTHCTNPSEHHMRQAIKMLKYIANTADLAIVFYTTTSNPMIYADASHATHHDGYGHGCVIMKLGSSLVYCRSYKLKIITLSSTEAEHVVLCDATTLAEWFKCMLLFMGVNCHHIIIKQDNTSAIWLSENDGNFARNKHLLIRRNKAKEGVLNGTTKIVYTPTEAMLADLGTKPLPLRQMLLHMKNLGMMIVTRPNDLYTLGQITIPAPRPVRRRQVAVDTPAEGTGTVAVTVPAGDQANRSVPTGGQVNRVRTPVRLSRNKSRSRKTNHTNYRRENI